MADLDNLFNGPANSLRDVYLKNSYGQLLITSIFSDWITVSMTQAQAAAGQSGLGGGVLQVRGDVHSILALFQYSLRTRVDTCAASQRCSVIATFESNAPAISQAAIREALTAAQSRGIDFSQFDKDGDGRMDMFSVLHSGYAAEWGGADYASVCSHAPSIAIY
jgi:M6 family metalloprotease-like protein